MTLKILTIIVIITSISSCGDLTETQSQSNSKKDNLQGDLTRKKIRQDKISVDIFEGKWPVQFMIEQDSFDPTVQALNSISKCMLITDFENHEVSPANVHSWTAQMLLFGDTIRVSKMTYTDWEFPIYSFNWEESFEQVKENSKIEEIEQALSKNGVKYTLVDYLKD